MKKIIAICDYKGRFGSKHYDNPYRSGMDKKLLVQFFNVYGYEPEFVKCCDLDFNRNDLNGTPVIYTSIEDIGYHYKSFIEDIVYGLENSGAVVIPSYKHLRANNNKVFMEILRKLNIKDYSPASWVFGSYEDAVTHIHEIKFPCVIKESEGASGSGVFLAGNENEFHSIIRKVSKTRYPKEDFRDHLRKYRHQGYIMDSRYRSKFIIQEYISELTNDWKIYLMGKRLYIMRRPILKGRGIKASGGGYENYFYGMNANAPEGLFDYAEKIAKSLNVPNISLDIGFKNNVFVLFEFQSVYFGTASIVFSDGYYSKEGNTWKYVIERLEIEKVYVDGIISHLQDLQVK